MFEMDTYICHVMLGVRYIAIKTNNVRREEHYNFRTINEDIYEGK